VAFLATLVTGNLWFLLASFAVGFGTVSLEVTLLATVIALI